MRPAPRHAQGQGTRGEHTAGGPCVHDAGGVLNAIPQLVTSTLLPVGGIRFESITHTLMRATQDCRYRHKENLYLNSYHTAQYISDEGTSLGTNVLLLCPSGKLGGAECSPCPMDMGSLIPLRDLKTPTELCGCRQTAQRLGCYRER